MAVLVSGRASLYMIFQGIIHHLSAILFDWLMRFHFWSVFFPWCKCFVTYYQSYWNFPARILKFWKNVREILKLLCKCVCEILNIPCRAELIALQSVAIATIAVRPCWHRWSDWAEILHEYLGYQAEYLFEFFRFFFSDDSLSLGTSQGIC
jgi:hypothetical protein